MLRQRTLLTEFSRVQSARIEARRRRTYANHEQALEGRRQALLEKEAQERKMMQQGQEVRRGQGLRGWGFGAGGWGEGKRGALEGRRRALLEEEAQERKMMQRGQEVRREIFYKSVCT